MGDLDANIALSVASVLLLYVYRGTAELSVPDRPTPEVNGVGWGWLLGLSRKEGLKRGLPAAADWGLWDGVLYRRSRARREGRLDNYFFQDGKSQGENETLATPRSQGNSCFPFRCQDSEILSGVLFPQTLVDPPEGEEVVEGQLRPRAGPRS